LTRGHYLETRTMMNCYACLWELCESVLVGGLK
jgi:hypothetical protein